MTGALLLVAALAVAQASPTPPSAAAASPSPAPPPSRPRVDSPVVDAGRITFALYSPQAREVLLRSGDIERALPGIAKAMARADNGVWSLTVGPVPPGLYEYAYDVDGMAIADPETGNIVTNARSSRSMVEVLGPPETRLEQWRQVPHGTVAIHWYDSKVTGTRRRVHVYTPPGYGESGSARYPVLYLLHGFSGHDAQWVENGRANVIADNLAAEGKVVPMIIVMPDGHAYSPKPGEPNPEATRMAKFEDDLLKEVVPLVERSYRVKADRTQRAITGLSMGGGQSLAVGLRNGDRFAWLGAFSGSLGAALPLIPTAAEAKAFNERTRLLWIGVGRQDTYGLPQGRGITEKFKAAGIHYKYVESEGAHTWSVWRVYLAEFLPLLFR